MDMLLTLVDGDACPGVEGSGIVIKPKAFAERGTYGEDLGFTKSRHTNADARSTTTGDYRRREAGLSASQNDLGSAEPLCSEVCTQFYNLDKAAEGLYSNRLID
jgi:hypothetical protein